MGSYKNAEALDKTSTFRRTPTIQFSKNEHERFTTKIAKSKLYVPGAGNYNVEGCFERLSRPPSAGVRRR